MKKTLFLFALFLSISFWVSHTNQRTDYWCRDQHFEEYQDGIINHTIHGPLAYRVLIPYTVDFLSHTIHLGSEKLMVLFLNILLLLFTQFAFLKFLKNFFSESASLAGTLWLDLSIMMGFTSFIGVHVYETSDIFNLLIISLGLHLTYLNRWKLLALVLFIGMLNRETPAFLLIPIGLLWFKKKVPAYGLALCAAAIFIPYFGLKALIHPPQASWFLTIYLKENIPFIAEGYGDIVLFAWLKLILLIGPVLWLALSGLKIKHEFLRVSLMIFPVFMIVHLIVGHVEEYRVWVPLFLLLIPLALETLKTEINGINREAGITG